MAGLLETRLQSWRVNSPIDRNATRPCSYGALDFFVEQTNAANSIISPELKKKAFESVGSDVMVPVIKYDETVSVSPSRTCVIADDENESALYKVTWATLQVGFTMVPSLYHNNEIGYEKDFNRKMEKVARALAADLDGKAIAALEANKTRVLKDKLNYKFSAQTIDVPRLMETEILGDINPIMRANCFPEQIHIIGNAGIESLIRKLAQHGIYNDVNKRMEYDDKVIHYDPAITNAGMKNGTFYAVADGNVGMLTRVDREALANAEMPDGTEWGVTNMPYIGVPVGYHYYLSKGDYSTIAGAASEDMKCVRKEHFGFSLDVAFITAYNSNTATLPGPIIKAQIEARPENQPIATPVVIVDGQLPA